MIQELHTSYRSIHLQQLAASQTSWPIYAPVNVMPHPDPYTYSTLAASQTSWHIYAPVSVISHPDPYTYSTLAASQTSWHIYAPVNVMPQCGEDGQTVGILTQNKYCVKIHLGTWMGVRILHVPQDTLRLLLQNSISEFPSVNKAMSDSPRIEKYILSKRPGLPILPTLGLHIDWCIISRLSSKILALM